MFMTVCAFINSNDDSYIPRSKRSRFEMSLKRRWRAISSHMDNVVDKIILSIGRTRDVKPTSSCRSNGRGSHKRILRLISLSAMAYQAKHDKRTNITRFDTDSAPVGIDNRCSGCISHVAEDFIGTLRDSDRTIKGFAGTRTTNIKVGTLLWRWSDNEGVTHKFEIPNSYFVPSGGVRLLSPQHWAKSQLAKTPKEKKKYGKYGTVCQTTAEDCTLTWNDKKNKLTVPLSNDSNVATFYLASGYGKYNDFCCSVITKKQESDSNMICLETSIIANPVTLRSHDKWSSEDTNNKLFGSKNDLYKNQRTEWDFKRKDIDDFNSTHPEEEVIDHVPANQVEKRNDTEGLLKIHNRFGHISFRKLQIMAQKGIIPKRYAKCDIPVCKACSYAKLVKRAWRGKPLKNYRSEKEGLKPGDMVSVDQLTSPTPGLVAQMTGRLTIKRYKYATVFVDQSSRFGYVHLQKSSDAEETIQGKKAFESFMKSNNIQVKAYYADNGVFRANKWVEECNKNHQELRFAGVNAHHQNGFAERRIRELQELARSMMIHANHHWPKTVTTNLWPYALRMANEIYNNTPSLQNDSYNTPMQSVSSSDVEINQKHYKTFGCPVFVLKRKLQEGKPYPKWDERARIGVYLGPSPHHNKNVALVLDRDSGLVSPQFHVLFDNEFQTVKDDKYDSSWQIKAGFSSQRELERINRKKDNAPVIIPGISKNPNIKDQNSEGDKPQGILKKGRKRKASGSDIHLGQKSTKRTKLERTVRWKEKEGATANFPRGELRRSPRLNPELAKAQELLSLQASITSKQEQEIPGEIFCMQSLIDDHDQLYEFMNPIAFKASSDPDTMYMHEAMRQSDRKEFIEAMQKEVQDQMRNKNFSIVHIDDVPRDKVILPAVWQMKRKRDIKSRKIKKYKARLNIDGSKMVKGIHYDQTYAPVASWNSIRILLTLVATFGWHTQQIDYVLAFPQAPVEKEIYMKVPKGFRITGKNSKDYVLKLNRNVYGQKQAGRVWNKFLEEKLINEVGFKKSKVDDCVFYKNNTMYVLYTDDSILAGPDKNEIDQIIKDIQNAGLNITREGDIKDFLGINIKKLKEGGIEFTQPHLIDQILNDLKMDKEEVKTKSIPCMVSNILNGGNNEEPFDNSFHYRSIIGKLNYLEKGTRSDISYITHQCARFTSNPKSNHAKAIRWVARYLKGTRKKGFVMKPDPTKGLEVYVDADFSGNWSREDSINQDSARSRHGYIIKYMNCPVTWKSQLQHEIALSSTESEYTGLSYALREAIPIMNLLEEMKEYKFIRTFETPEVKIKVYEDNSGALHMANIHKYRPRTKHLNVKLHHFRKYVNDGSIKVVHIKSEEQQADYLTKPVKFEILTKLRKLVMGW